MKVSPALVLFFLAPAVAELLSGSAPPSEFFNPVGFLLLASLYGSEALVVRELKVGWNKGYVSMFALGARARSTKKGKKGTIMGKWKPEEEDNKEEKVVLPVHLLLFYISYG